MAPFRRQTGFTMIEVMIVVVLMAVLAAALLPGLGGRFGLGIRGATEDLAADLRYASQRAIATGRAHYWVVDFEEQAFRLEVARRPGPATTFELPSHAELLDLAPPESSFELIPVQGRSGSWRWLDDDGVLIESVAIGEEVLDDEVASIAFAGDGGSDPAEILLSDEYGHVTLLRILPFTGEVRIVEDADAP